MKRTIWIVRNLITTTAKLGIRVSNTKTKGMGTTLYRKMKWVNTKTTAYPAIM